MNQDWFEMRDIRARSLTKVVWIPLRVSHTLERVGEFGHAGFLQEFYGAGSLAVPVESKADALTLSWDSIGILHDHCGHAEDGRYVPADVFEDYQKRFTGVHLALHQRGGGDESAEWHLHQDFVTTLGLKRESDVWVRPDEDYIEVARLVRADKGGVVRLEVRALHLRDYLCARGMGLVISSYRERNEVLEDASHISWPDGHVEEKEELARWVGRKGAIHEGGREHGGSVAVFHVARTDVDPEDDVPILGSPTDDNLKSSSWTQKFSGRKLHRVSGDLWRTEWIDPAPQSPIVRGDEIPSSVSYLVDAGGTRELSGALKDSGRWLWFKPAVIGSLITRRGASLEWYTRETGAVHLSGHRVHFGLNSIGLVTVYAKDIAHLPDWQQRVWAAHNVSPEGKVSDELQASQVHASPADTQAPEAFLGKALAALQSSGEVALGIRILRQHEYVKELLPRLHRFRAMDRQGLFALAKDVARITADDIDAKQLQTIASPPKETEWGSLKSLEKVLATRIDPDKARSLLSPLVGIYELRLADAHLPTDDVKQAFKLVGIDESLPPTTQACQLLHAAVSSLYRICRILDEHW